MQRIFKHIQTKSTHGQNVEKRIAVQINHIEKLNHIFLHACLKNEF